MKAGRVGPVGSCRRLRIGARRSRTQPAATEAGQIYYRLLSFLLIPLLIACSDDETIVVGAKAFDEGYLLGHIAAERLRDAGYKVEEQFGLASSAMRSGLESGQVDLYYEYTGTAYTVYAGGTDEEVMVDPERVFHAIHDYDSIEYDLIWLRPMSFNNTYALLKRRSDSDMSEVSSLSDLGAAVESGYDLTIAVDAEFYERPDGLKAMIARYDMPDVDVVKMDAGLIYSALAEGEIDIGMGYSTDGRIEALDLATLGDDRAFFPTYNPAAVVRKKTLRRHPEMRRILEDLNAHMTTEEVRRLNAHISMLHHDPRNVARKWLDGLQRLNANHPN